MSKKLKIFLLFLFCMSILMLLLIGCSKTNPEKTISIQNENDTNVDITKENAKALNVGTPQIVKEINDWNDKKIDTITRVENSSTFDIYDIFIIYDEYDKNQDVVFSNSKAFLDITLTPGKVSYIGFTHKEFAESVKVKGYEYEAEGKHVTVNLEKNTINIKNSQDELENSKNYEVLVVSDLEKINQSNEGYTYSIKIKNSSSKDLGNVTLKVAEVNDAGEYIMLDHVPSYSVLKASEEIELDIVSSNKATSLKVLGYIYDDPKDKSSVDIDLESHKVRIDK